WAAWATDHRTVASPAPKDLGVEMAAVDDGGLRHSAFGLPIPSSSPRRPNAEGRMPPEAEGHPPPNAPPVHPHEVADIARVRGHRIAPGGRSYRILRGDLHRHTDNSHDGAGDGSLTDLYRYALDAAGLDYILVTDHNDGNDAEYPWWRREKS